MKIFADGADKARHVGIERQPAHQGHDDESDAHAQGGHLTDFEAFARDILQSITAKPISLEVFSDEFPEMKRQALKINGWAKNVYVKIPITNTRDESSLPLISELANEGVKLNVTAILTLEQVEGVAAALNPKVPAVVSVFAGRIADTGVDPMPHHARMQKDLERLAAGRTALGERPRSAEYFSGERLRLRHRHRAA